MLINFSADDNFFYMSTAHEIVQEKYALLKGNKMRTNQPHSQTWVNFVYGSFLGSLLLSGTGLFFLPTDLWPKGYLAMGYVMTVMTSIILTKNDQGQP